MLIIGLTGGIGSGKSTVTRKFAQLGVPIIDTDLIARELVEPGQPTLQLIEDSFGPGLIQPDGTLNRQRLRELAFESDVQRKKLESILHPAIKLVVLQQIEALRAPYCIVVIPLLVESGWQTIVDRVCVVDVPPELQLKRASQRDSTDRKTIESIMRAQVDRQTRLAAAHEVIDNAGTIESLDTQVNRLHEQYLALSKTKDFT